MYVEAKVKGCDFTDKTYSPPVTGAHLVAQGASGRWCAVLDAGPEYLERRGIVPFTYEEALEEIEAKGDGGWADF